MSAFFFEKNYVCVIIIIEGRRLVMNEFEKPISPSPFANLTEAELLFLLKNKKDSLTPAQILDIEARLNAFQQTMKQEATIEFTEPQKTYVKTMNNNNIKRNAGYADIVILMLSAWATCLCGLAYIYSQINIMG